MVLEKFNIGNLRFGYICRGWETGEKETGEKETG